MAKARRNTTYEITIGGLYFGTTEGRTETLPYEVTVLMDQGLVNAGPLSVFKRHIAPDLMPKRYPNYTYLHTYEIRKTSAQDGDGAGDNLQLMTRPELEAYIADEGMPVNLDLYDDIGALCQAVISYKEDAESFLKTQATMQERKSGAMALRRKARELNPPLAATTNAPAGRPGRPPKSSSVIESL